MNRTAAALCLAFVVGWLPALGTVARAEPKGDDKQPPQKLADIHVILNVDLKSMMPITSGL